MFVGTNKITKTLPDALARTQEYALPIESASMRATTSYPGSMLLNTVILSGDFLKRVHVVLIKESLGY